MQIKSATFGQLQNNCYLVTDEASGRSALVDCTEYSDKMKDFIGDAKLDYILLTHGHFDHIGGVAAVKAATGAKVVISAEDAPMLTSSRKSLAAFSFLSQAPAQAGSSSLSPAILSPWATRSLPCWPRPVTPPAVCVTLQSTVFLAATRCFSALAGARIFPAAAVEKLWIACKNWQPCPGTTLSIPATIAFPP